MHTLIEKSRARSSRCCGQPFVDRVGNKGNDINWDRSPVSSPATVLIHCGEVNKVKVKERPIPFSAYIQCFPKAIDCLKKNTYCSTLIFTIASLIITRPQSGLGVAVLDVD